jgi:hypothetical protein
MFERLGRAGAGAAAGVCATARAGGDRAGAAAEGADRGPASVTTRGRTAMRARAELGAASVAAAGSASRGCARCGARGQRLVLGRRAGLRAVGARQRRTCAAPARRHPGPGSVHARAAPVVQPLPVRAAPRTRTHGRSSAAVARQRGRARVHARCPAPEGRPRGPGGGRPGPTAGAAGTCAAQPGGHDPAAARAREVRVPARAHAARRTRWRTSQTPP